MWVEQLPNGKFRMVERYIDPMTGKKKRVSDFNDHVIFIDSTGWIPADPLHPWRDGHKTVAAHLTQALRPHLS